VALAGEGAAERKSGFAEMVDTDRIQKRADLTCGFFTASPQSEARLPQRHHTCSCFYQLPLRRRC
jgi:hypothetical protein